ncbi:MAG: M20/M25/M40 family metallo-hydrolase [Puniceicoccales bacterium]|jgi:endoglucanase|nr:M20/M25/M40 family metallo-hydrolase [Puniceicoccales bacterium]
MSSNTNPENAAALPPFTPPPFLVELLDAKSPTGHEFASQAVVDKYVKSAQGVARYEKDALGNRIATVNPAGNPTVMFAGHIDEIALQVSYIDDKGFLYFDFLGGHDLVIPSGRRVRILTKNGPVLGVTGKRAVHLMSAEDRRKVPERHDMWLDIGAGNREEAEKIVRIGDPAVYDVGFELLRGSVGVARAFDDKAGCYLVMEALLRLAKKEALAARVISVGTTQEEIGTRGAQVAAQGLNPDVAIAVDVTHATDHPDADNRKFGRISLRGGPVIARGPNINPLVFDRLVEVAETLGIPCQIQAEPRPTGTDARAIQMANAGVACGLVSVPLRYMHTPGEIVDLAVVEQGVRLLVGFAESLKPGETFAW